MIATTTQIASRSPYFTTKGGLEELLHTEEAFSNAAEDLAIGEDDYIKYFGRRLCVNAQSKWRALTKTKENNRDKYPATKARYEAAFKAFIRMYCYPEDANKDIMHVYLRGPACKKKSKSTCQEHTEQLLTLIKYTAKLQGFVTDLDHLQSLTIILHSYPHAWIEDYVRIHLKITEETTDQFIINHMSSHERLSKQKSNKNNGRRPNNSSKGSNANRKGSNNISNKGNNSSNKKESNPCRISGHDHDWSECPNNRYSKNYKGKGNNSNTKSSGNNESFQAHMKTAMEAAVESYQTDYGGQCKRSIDGKLVWLP